MTYAAGVRHHAHRNSERAVAVTIMTDVNVNRRDPNAVAALRSCILETINKAQKPGHPPNAEDIFDAVCGFFTGQVPIETDDEGLALLSYVEAVVETETGYLFNKRRCSKYHAV